MRRAVLWIAVAVAAAGLVWFFGDKVAEWVRGLHGHS